MTTAIFEPQVSARCNAGAGDRPITTVLMPLASASAGSSRAAILLKALAEGERRPVELAKGLGRVKDQVVQAWDASHGLIGTLTGDRVNALYGSSGEVMRASVPTTDHDRIRMDEAAGEAGRRHKGVFQALAERGDDTLRMGVGGSRSMNLHFQALAQDQDGVVKGWGSTMRAMAHLSMSEKALVDLAPDAKVDQRVQRALTTSAAEFARASRDLDITSRYQPRLDGDQDGLMAKHLSGAGRSFEAAWKQTLQCADLWGQGDVEGSGARAPRRLGCGSCAVSTASRSSSAAPVVTATRVEIEPVRSMATHMDDMATQFRVARGRFQDGQPKLAIEAALAGGVDLSMPGSALAVARSDDCRLMVQNAGGVVLGGSPSWTPVPEAMERRLHSATARHLDQVSDDAWHVIARSTNMLNTGLRGISPDKTIEMLSGHADWIDEKMPGFGQRLHAMAIAGGVKALIEHGSVAVDVLAPRIARGEIIAGRACASLHHALGMELVDQGTDLCVATVAPKVAERVDQVKDVSQILAPPVGSGHCRHRDDAFGVADMRHSTPSSSASGAARTRSE